MYRHILPLDGTWTLRRADESTAIPCIVPGTVYGTLLEQGLMPDPFFRDQEDLALPLMEHDWVYERTFEPDDQLLAAIQVYLVFEGLDTVAEVSLNGQFLFEAVNMHRTWQIDVKPYLKPGKNTLTLLIRSPLQLIRDAQKATPTYGSTDALPGYPMLRKSHCMFGWDWGPRLPDAGIFRPVYLWAVSTPKLRSVMVRQVHQAGRVTLRIQPELYEDFPERDFTFQTILLSPEGKERVRTSSDQLEVPSPQLWWPNGYGAQPLYTLRVELCTPGGTPLDLWERKIGLRSLELRRPKDADGQGEGFFLRVNGVDIFCMGADYIPEDSLLSRVTPSRTRQLLEDAVSAHFNCIRVWGGGYYPDDFFFDLCDELGLLVWQDFMFACAVYRLTPSFEENIRAEFRDNIVRLRHHPSLALWCGNNEVESAVTGHWYPHGPIFSADYIKLFEYILPKAVSRLDPDRPYWPSSPSSGGAFDAPSDPRRGDVHYWDVWHGGKPFTDYRNHQFRFVSEFGFQSFPPMRTIEAYTLPGDRNIFSYVMEKHQRNHAANGKIMTYMAQTYLYPSSFDTLVYASQLLQADAIRCGVEHWRRHRGECMGAIIWQLNDCWPVASWASIDYFGRWKALHYQAKHFFSPVLLSCEEDGILSQRENVNADTPLSSVHLKARLNISNETFSPVEGRITWSLRRPDGSILKDGTVSLLCPALSAVWSEDLFFPGEDPYGVYLSYSMEAGGITVSDSCTLFCPPKHFRFRNPHLTLSRSGDEITVHASAFASKVEIYAEDGDLLLSDNFFDMNPGSRSLRILRGSAESLRVRSVWDIR
ncbi:MAG: glycoside hydrolase family 2 protein [Clostridia bacterium]|nr:glycoside hydrolase family 2 protein [Clostridia bacterium]